jgi:hypothetical protein
MTTRTCPRCADASCSFCKKRERFEAARAAAAIASRRARNLAANPAVGVKCVRCHQVRHRAEFKNHLRSAWKGHCAMCRRAAQDEACNARLRENRGMPDDDAQIARDLALMRETNNRLREARLAGQPTARLEAISKAVRVRLRIGAAIADELRACGGPRAKRRSSHNVPRAG